MSSTSIFEGYIQPKNSLLDVKRISRTFNQSFSGYKSDIPYMLMKKKLTIAEQPLINLQKFVACDLYNSELLAIHPFLSKNKELSIESGTVIDPILGFLYIDSCQQNKTRNSVRNAILLKTYKVM